MMRTAIRAHQLSKQYRLGPRYGWPTETLRDTITDGVSRTVSAVRRAFNGSTAAPLRPAAQRTSMWALRDVSFDIAQGEVVGIIGPNGAGKSTLLRILSRITEPTVGYADITGRVGSLLEVGMGFHGELTGRENIYLSGAMLGMRRAEIERKFDSIIEFSEVAEFIDTPTKFYSTGMYMRLAFAVAVHLEPDILLVDEVLAVGDLAFQRKCLRKMETVAARGHTVLFVSHNLAAMQELCETAIVLIDGQLTFKGDIREGVSCYAQKLLHDTSDLPPTEGVTQWRQVCVNGYRAGAVVTTPGGRPFYAVGTMELATALRGGRFLFALENARGEMVLEQAIECTELGSGLLNAGLHEIRIDVPSLWLAPGLYTLHFKFTAAGHEVLWSPPAMLNIEGSLGAGGSGVLAAPIEWRVVASSYPERALVS